LLFVIKFVTLLAKNQKICFNQVVDMTRNIDLTYKRVNQAEQGARLTPNTLEQLTTLLTLRKAQLSESAERQALQAIVQTLLDNFKAVAA
jgi:hypothetical protein